jgi:hypothetical protein
MIALLLAIAVQSPPNAARLVEASWKSPKVIARIDTRHANWKEQIGDAVSAGADAVLVPVAIGPDGLIRTSPTADASTPTLVEFANVTRTLVPIVLLIGGSAGIERPLVMDLLETATLRASIVVARGADRLIEMRRRSRSQVTAYFPPVLGPNNFQPAFLEAERARAGGMAVAAESIDQRIADEARRLKWPLYAWDVQATDAKRLKGLKVNFLVTDDARGTLAELR